MCRLPFIEHTVDLKSDGMKKLVNILKISIAISFGLCQNLTAQEQNPHGEDFAIDCKDCHSADSWEIDMKKLDFDHNRRTSFSLDGQHEILECKACHEDLSFQNTETGCVDCHTDVHNMSVGNDCARCHSAESWLVNDVQSLHEQNGFTLVGAHAVLSCVDCHIQDNPLQWDRIGNECKDCHMEEYNSAQEPNHIVAGFSTECVVCHEPNQYEWGRGNAHFFFPLEGGHNLDNCSSCHVDAANNVFSGLTQRCADCHQDDYNSAQNPNHVNSNFSLDCTECHSIFGWSPANFRSHDNLYFPIYSGNHQGEWGNDCRSCHLDPTDYSQFSCIDCHEHNDPGDLAGEHGGVSGYIYESQACYNCHPNGDS